MELTNDFRVNVALEQAWEVLTDVERIAPLLPGAQLQEVEGEEYRGIVKVKVGPIQAQYKGTASFLERDHAAGKVVLKAVGRDTRGQGNANATVTAVLTGDGTGTKVSVVTDLTITGKVAQFGRGVLADVSGKLIGQFVDALEADLRAGDRAATQGASAAAAPSGAPAAPSREPHEPVGPAAAGAVAAGEALVGVPDVAAPAAAPGSPPATTGLEAVVGDGPVGAGTTAPLPAGVTATPPAGIRRIDAPEPEPVDLLDAAGGSVARRLLPAVGVVAALVAVIVLRRRSAKRRTPLARLGAAAGAVPAAVGRLGDAAGRLPAVVGHLGDAAGRLPAAVAQLPSPASVASHLPSAPGIDDLRTVGGAVAEAGRGAGRRAARRARRAQR